MDIPIPSIGVNEIYPVSDMLHDKWVSTLCYLQFYYIGDGLMYIPSSNLTGEN